MKTRKAKKMSTPTKRLRRNLYLFRCVGVGLQAAGGPEMKEQTHSTARPRKPSSGRNAIVVLECRVPGVVGCCWSCRVNASCA